MQPKSTDELTRMLRCAPSLDGFFAEQDPTPLPLDFQTLLEDSFRDSGLTKAGLAKKSGMSEVYIHQLFAGTRRPSRDRLICLIIALGLDPDESRKLLRSCGYTELYVRVRREAIILFGLGRRMSLFEINDLLFDYGEETLT